MAFFHTFCVNTPTDKRKWAATKKQRKWERCVAKVSFGVNSKNPGRCVCLWCDRISVFSQTLYSICVLAKTKKATTTTKSPDNVYLPEPKKSAENDHRENEHTHTENWTEPKREHGVKARKKSTCVWNDEMCTNTLAVSLVDFNIRCESCYTRTTHILKLKQNQRKFSI